MSGEAGKTIVFTVNGVERQAEFRRGLTLMEYLREDLGLTGTKCGCGTGECGSCKVLVDGEAVNSCTLTLKNLSGKKVVTIEGISPDSALPGTRLHPVQQAFIDTGAIQCGFCTPGMVITAVALLDRDPAPDEAAIRKALGGNICRCTGYRKIVEAIRLASKLTAGEARAQEPGAGGSLPVGSPSPLHDARLKVTGRLKYTGDMHFPGMLHAKVLYAPAAHGYVTSIDTSEAEALPGVRAVATFLNAPEREFNSHITVPFQDVPKNERIFNRHFRFHGDRIAAVAADDERTAREALRLIKLEWEEYPFHLTPEASLAEGAYPIHEGGNLADTIRQGTGKEQEGGERFEGRFTLPKVTHAALERHISVSDFDGRTLTVYSSCQNVFCYQAMLAELFDLPYHRVRVIKPPVGGAFGGKSEMVTEPVSSLLALMTGRPVKLELSRKEVMSSTRTRTSGTIEVSMVIDEQGRFLSHDYKAVLDRGAYFGSAWDLGYALMDKAYRLYRAPRILTEAKLVYTNNQCAGAVRGYGNPQISFAREVLIDRICRAKGYDPVRFRLENLVRNGDKNPLNGESLGSCRIAECLVIGARRCGWDEKRAAAKGPGRYRRGIGVACGVHGSGIHPDCVDYSTASARMYADGTLRLAVSAHENGQGCSVVMAKIAAQALGIEETSVALMETDTMATWFDNGSYASRETWVCGGAVLKASLAVRAQLVREASAMLGCPEEDVIQVRGGFRAAGGSKERIISHGALVLHAQNNYPYRDVYAVESYASPLDPGAFFANFAEVEVDTEEKTVRVLKVTAVHDSGTVVNPLLVEGQVDGGLHMGLGYALGEELLTDPETGRQLTLNFRGYRMLSAEQMPEVDIFFVPGEEPRGPYGAKGVGEATTVAVAPAVANAVADALGVEISSLPIELE